MARTGRGTAMSIENGFKGSSGCITGRTFMRAQLTGVLILCAVLIPAIAHADDDAKDGTGVRLGVSLLEMRDKNNKAFWAGSIPEMDLDIPLYRRYLQLELGWGMTWGFSKFFVDRFPWLPSLGLRFYPAGKTVSFYGNGEWGTFIFNNSTLMCEGGADVEFPIAKEHYGSQPFIYLGLGGFYRKVYALGDFIPHDEKHDQWYMSSTGVAFRIGLAARTFDSN
jgi:hypothetical protein